ncbi:APC family permease [uncultured Selenomonas sp.]|uniref:APC family permease n=1 Tax=uncultured Selenomonas sp. TaxID=159275 RepID=UPI0025FF3329|nr:APC family permease [uncultured Selenomonas sp.]
MSDLLLRPPVGSTGSAAPMESTIRGHHVNTMKRSLSWVDVFFIASGVPALVLFSIGALANQVGTPSHLVWTLSVLMGFLQAFTYAEISGLFPNKSGGASIYGSIGWMPYSKFIAPLSVWCNWVAWSPILSIGTGLIAGYILTSLFPPDSAIMTWQYTIANLSFISDGLTIRLNARFFLAAVFLVAIFTAQYFGISKAAKITMFLSLVGLLPLLLVSLVPLVTGEVDFANFQPYVPVNGAWDFQGIGIFLSGMYVAAWTTYAFETCVCYTKEFKHPKTDVPKSLIFSGLLCVVMFSLVPFVFEGVLGLDALNAPDIVDGTGVARAMGGMLGAGMTVTHAIVVMLLFSITLAVMTAMAGSSRTLYQASVDGWLPRYLSKVNKHGSPIFAMCTDLCFNLFLLTLSDYMVVLIASNCGYIIFSFLNLQSGWIHRIDRAKLERPFKAPTAILGIDVVLSFCNVAFLGVAAAYFGASNILAGLIICSLIVPVFLFRHYIQDKGQFPQSTLEEEEDGTFQKKCGIFPYITLIAAVCTAYGFYRLFS